MRGARTWSPESRSPTACRSPTRAWGGSKPCNCWIPWPKACDNGAWPVKNETETRMKVVQKTGDGSQTEQRREPGSGPSRTDDLRISGIRALIPPQLLAEEMPIDAASLAVVSGARQAIHRVLHGADD